MQILLIIRIKERELAVSNFKYVKSKNLILI
jgi:hypothetical protein